MQGIDYVAWWGAIVATLVFAWDIAKWLKDGPVIRSRVQLNTAYADARVVRTEKIENGESKELALYCHVELVNIGKLPTTIMGVSASHSKGKETLQMTATSQRFTPHYGKTLPHVLGSGEVWSCRIEMEDIQKLSQKGEPYIEVSVSHKKEPIIIKLCSANNSLQPTGYAGG